MNSAKEVVETDLEYVCQNLAQELRAMAGKELLIVGGAGFLGYYLVQSILHANRTRRAQPAVRVTVYDNYSRGVPSWLTDLSSDPNLTLERHDITDPLPRDIRDFAYIVHGGSIASPTYYRQHPIETMDANVNGVRTLLEYARHQAERGRPLDGFLFFSSSEIYGDPTPDAIPTPETYRGNVSCTGPRACYDESKRYGETLCVNFARDVLAGRDIVMLSDGGPKRTFCYVAEAVIGYYKILVRGHAGEAYNIGVESPEISVAELADRIAALGRELVGYRGSVVRKPSADGEYLVDNPARRCPMIEKARAHLGFDPKISLDDALRRSFLWYRDNRVAEDL